MEAIVNIPFEIVCAFCKYLKHEGHGKSKIKCSYINGEQFCDSRACPFRKLLLENIFIRMGKES